MAYHSPALYSDLCDGTMSSCPCKRRKNGSLLITCSQNCEFKTWHTECAGFNNIVNKKQVEEIGAWNCPCCAVRALQIPGYYKGTVKHDLIEKMDEKLDLMVCIMK